MNAGCPMPQCTALHRVEPLHLHLRNPLQGPLRPRPSGQHQRQPSSPLRSLRAQPRHSRRFHRLQLQSQPLRLQCQSLVGGTGGDGVAATAGSPTQGGVMGAGMTGRGMMDRRPSGAGAARAETGMTGGAGPGHPSGMRSISHCGMSLMKRYAGSAAYNTCLYP